VATNLIEHTHRERDEVGETALAGVKATLDRILADPTSQVLWELQKELLALSGSKGSRGDKETARRAEQAEAAREVVRAFHSCLRNLDSKTSSRSASRWGAVLGTAAVGSTGIQELLAQQNAPLTRLLESGVPALLEVGSAVKSAQAWEVEARLVYDEVAWFLYEQLWDISAAAGLPDADRRAQIDLLLDPVLDPDVPDAEKAPLVIRLFQAVLAARLQPLLGNTRR
jgi:hypothetical protein